MNKVLYSHNTDDWKTPKNIHDWFIRDHNYIDCFPYHSNYDEFQKVYYNKSLFVNPPFSKLKFIPNWVQKQIVNNCVVALLIPSRTDTIYFHELLKLHPSIYFIKGRLHFNDTEKCCPFPTMILTFYPKPLLDLYFYTGNFVFPF